MPHGTPDWGLVGPRSTTYGLDDLGEHAVRLGSPHLWDRRGDAIFQTDFRDGLGDVEAFPGGAADIIVLHTRYARQGTFCVKLTAGAPAGGIAQVGKIVPYPVYSLLGMEVSFGCHDDTAYMELYAYLRDAANTYRAVLRWDPTLGTIEVQTGALAWHLVTAAQAAYVVPQCCNTIKVVFDVPNGNYVRVLANDQVYSVAGVPLYILAVGGASYFYVRVGHYGDAGKTPDAYVDSVIVTQNEP